MAIKSESPITPVTRASSTLPILAKSASERALVDNDHIDPLSLMPSSNWTTPVVPCSPEDPLPAGAQAFR